MGSPLSSQERQQGPPLLRNSKGGNKGSPLPLEMQGAPVFTPATMVYLLGWVSGPGLLHLPHTGYFAVAPQSRGLWDKGGCFPLTELLFQTPCRCRQLSLQRLNSGYAFKLLFATTKAKIYFRKSESWDSTRSLALHPNPVLKLNWEGMFLFLECNVGMKDSNDTRKKKSASFII